MITGPARLYGVDSPTTGEDARFSIEGSNLEVRAGDKALSCALSAVRIREVGTGRMGLEFAWDTDAGIRAVQVFDEVVLASLHADRDVHGLSQVAALRLQQRRGSAGRAVGWIALAIFLLLPLILIAVFVWQADRIARVAAAQISIDQEASLGDHAFSAMQRSLELQDSGHAFDAVQSIGARLTQGSKYTYRFHVAKDDTVNAFAVPGGIIVVHTGLINATRRPEELAGVLAHEVQHVEQRHSLHALIKDAGLRGLWLLMSGDVGGGLAGQAALKLTSLSFSRDAESDADARGFDDLVDAGIDPRGMASFFITMGERESAAAPPPFMSTHPASGERESAMKAREAAIAGTSFVPLDFGPWPPE